MSFSIKARLGLDENSPWIFEKNFDTFEEFHEVDLLCKGSNLKERANFIEQMFTPTRTDTLSNACKDLFFPMLFNTALKIDKLAIKLLVIPGSILLDMLTFPIRLINLIPIYLSNDTRDAHPLHRFLSENGADQSLLQTNTIFLEKYFVRNGGSGEEQIWQNTTFDFIRVPQSDTSFSRSSRSIS